MTNTQGPDTPEAWGAASRGYGENVAPVLMAPFVEELADKLEVTSEHQVLEVAAGTGIFTEVLTRRAKSVFATDFAPEMLEVLRGRLGDVANLELAVMDGQALEVEDASFDRAACCFGLMLFPDRAKGFSELRRALRPGGRAVVSGWGGPDKFEGFMLFVGALNAAFPDLPPPPAPPPVFSLSDLGAFKSSMEAAGFSDVETFEVTRDLELDGFDTFWKMLTAGAPPVQMLFDRVGPGGKTRIRDSLEQIIDERFGSGPIRTTNTATVGCGVA